MKRHLKRYTSLTHYIEFLRRQPDHMQHIYAVVFAGSITALLAFIILYVDYGFWHERYIRDDNTVSTNTASMTSEVPTPESPGEMFSRFFGEAKDRLGNINTSGADLLQGKDIYTSDSN